MIRRFWDWLVLTDDNMPDDLKLGWLDRKDGICNRKDKAA